MYKNNYVLFNMIIIIWGLLEIYNVNIILSKFLMLSRKQSKRYENIIKTIIFIFILGTYGLFVWNGKELYYVHTLTVLIFLKSSILFSAFYKIKLKHIAFIAFFVELVSFTGSNVSILLWKLGFKWPLNYISAYLAEVTGEIILLFLILILQILRKRNVIRFWLAELDAFDYILYTVIFYSLGMWEVYICVANEMPSIYHYFFYIILVCTIIATIRTIIITRSRSSLESIKGLLEGQMLQLTDHYNQIVEKENESRKFRHDIKNLLLVLHSMIEDNQTEKALSYMKDLQEICNQSKVKYDSGNFIADAILSTKQTKAQQYNTQIEFEGRIPDERVKDTDIVIMLSNILDNAIEACAKLEGQKVIKVSSLLKKKVWIMKTENPSTDVSIHSNCIETTKEEKEIHGFGLANIERAAKRYGGKMELLYENGIFRSVISFMWD